MSNQPTTRKDEKVSTLKKVVIALIFLLGLVFLWISENLHDHKLWELLFHLLGAFLVIAIPLEVLRELFFEEINKNSFVSAVDRLFDKKIDSQLIKARIFGLDRIEGSLPIEKLFDDLKGGDTLWWLDTFCPGHKQWINHVKKSIEQGASVNMLILNPDSPLCEMRAKELADQFDTIQEFKDELKLFISAFKGLEERLKNKTSVGNFEIRFYNDLLGVPCYVVERNKKAIYSYSSMYLSAATGVEFPHFVWNQGEMCENLFRYVKRKWESCLL